jgi:hypothetical protein
MIFFVRALMVPVKARVSGSSFEGENEILSVSNEIFTSE